MESDSDTQILRESEAAAYVKLSARTLQKYRREGLGPAFTRLGIRRIGYQKCDLDTWLNDRKFISRADELSRK